jgi:hypothetical protein
MQLYMISMLRYTVTCFKDIACPWSCFCISFRVITVLRSLKVSFTCSMVLRRRVGLDSRLLASQQTKWDLQNVHENPEGKMKKTKKKTWLPYDIDIMPIVDTHRYRRIIHEVYMTSTEENIKRWQKNIIESWKYWFDKGRMILESCILPKGNVISIEYHIRASRTNRPCQIVPRKPHVPSVRTPCAVHTQQSWPPLQSSTLVLNLAK